MHHTFLAVEVKKMVKIGVHLRKLSLDPRDPSKMVTHLSHDPLTDFHLFADDLYEPLALNHIGAEHFGH